MLMKSVKSNLYWKILLLTGIVTLVFGVIIYNVVSVEGRNISMLKGMIVGAGSAFTAIGGIKLYQSKRISPEKLKAKEIELKDERNIEIYRVALSVSSTAGILLFALLAFIFVAMDFIVPALMCIVAMYIQLLTLFIAYKYFNKKM